MRRTFAIIALVCSLGITASANDGRTTTLTDQSPAAAISQTSTSDVSFDAKHKKSDQDGKQHKHKKHGKKHGKHHTKHKKSDKG